MFILLGVLALLATLISLARTPTQLAGERPAADSTTAQSARHNQA